MRFRINIKNGSVTISSWNQRKPQWHFISSMSLDSFLQFVSQEEKERIENKIKHNSFATTMFEYKTEIVF